MTITISFGFGLASEPSYIFIKEHVDGKSDIIMEYKDIDGEDTATSVQGLEIKVSEVLGTIEIEKE